MKPWAPIPDRMVMDIEGLDEFSARPAAMDAVALAKRYAPKMSGDSASRLQPVWGKGWFGVLWEDDHVWYQEMGVRSFTMRKLAGKVIPMWLDDPTGRIARENPKAKKRTTASGKQQVLIFRRAAKIGARKLARRGGRLVDVPASYPGAPGRIAVREARRPWTTPGKVGGQVAARNIGVRWRFPGLLARSFIARSLTQAAYQAGLPVGTLRTARGAR